METEIIRKRHPVLGRMKHDGGLYGPGSEVDLTEAEAETLIALGIVGRPAEPGDRSEPGDPPEGSKTAKAKDGK